MTKKQSNLDRKLDSFARVTFIGADGRPKSAVWLYAFMLSILFGLLFVAAYLAFGFLFGRNADAGIGTIVLHALVSAVAGSIPAILLAVLLKKEKKALTAYAYVWLAVLFVLSLIMGLLLCDWKSGTGWADFLTLATIVYFPSLLAILIGGIPSWILYRRECRRLNEIGRRASDRPTYYNS
ncbi:MAG: hypothetical protein II914_06390 [Clostridia bacterium]|nr:hypothetical protein [Clostridia bacterium]